MSVWTGVITSKQFTAIGEIKYTLPGYTQNIQEPGTRIPIPGEWSGIGKILNITGNSIDITGQHLETDIGSIIITTVTQNGVFEFKGVGCPNLIKLLYDPHQTEKSDWEEIAFEIRCAIASVKRKEGDHSGK